MKKAISLLLVLATLVGCCAGMISCNGNKDKDKEEEVEIKKLNFTSDVITDFNQESVITGSGLTVTTDNVKTASKGGVWNTQTVTLGFSKTDLSSYKELSVWINNTSKSNKSSKATFKLISDDPSTNVVDCYTVTMNVHPGWHQYTLPFSEIACKYAEITPKSVKTEGTPVGLDSISGLTIERTWNDGLELVIDSVYAKTQMYGTFEGQSYTQLSRAVVFFEDSYAYLYDQLRYVIDETNEKNAVKGDNDTTFVPIAVLAEHRGATDIVSTAEKVSFKYNGETYEYKAGDTVTYQGHKDGKQSGKALSSKLIAVANYVMVPMDICADVLGYELYYDISGLVAFSDIKDILIKSEDNNGKGFDTLFGLIDVIAFTSYSATALVDNMNELYGEEGHTKLLLNDADFARLRKLLDTDATYASWFRAFEAEYAKGTANYNKRDYKYYLPDGYRMLDLSKEIVNVVVPYAFLYKMTGNEDYSKKCYEILEKTTKFVDSDVTGAPSWHPEHFLDTGEMMFAFSVGYDWCYDAFTPEQRQILEDGVWELGFGAALGFGQLYDFWDEFWSASKAINETQRYEECLAAYNEKRAAEGKQPYDGNYIHLTGNHGVPYKFDPDINKNLQTYNLSISRWGNNWNAVCNGGILSMALAFANVNEEFREASELLIQACLKGFGIGLRNCYGPDGGYDEGPGYWSYGTEYSIIFIQSMMTACGTDTGYFNSPGFRESFYYMNYIGSINNGGFNVGDSGTYISKARWFWFANVAGDADIGGLCYDSILNGSAEAGIWNLMYYDPETINKGEITLGLDKCYYGIDTATFRSDWSENAMFAGLHGGYNDYGHGNFDIGTFVLDMGGTRFFIDLGSDNYNLKNSKYASGTLYFAFPFRFWFYRMRAEGQNTLVINPQKVNIDNKIAGNDAQGKNYDQKHAVDSQIQKYDSGESSAYAVVDMGCAYFDMTKGVRGMYITEDRSTVVIQDEAILTKTNNEVYWMGHIVEGGEIEISEDGKTAIITHEGLSMVCSIVVPEGYTGDFRFQRMAADYLQQTGLVTCPDEKDRSKNQKLVAYSNNCPRELKLAIVCRLLNDGAHNYTWTDIDNWVAE